MGELPNQQPINQDVQPPDGWPDNISAQLGENVIPTPDDINGGVTAETQIAGPTPEEIHAGSAESTEATEQQPENPAGIEPAYPSESEATEQSETETTESSSETSSETAEVAPENVTELEHSIDHGEELVQEAAPESAPERKKGDVYQNEEGKWIRFNGTLTSEDGTKMADESDVTGDVEYYGLDKFKDKYKYHSNKIGQQLQPNDEHFIGRDHWTGGDKVHKRLSEDEARMQADLLQMDRSEIEKRKDGSEYPNGRGPFGYAGTGRDGVRFGDNMDRRAKYMELHKEIDPELAEIRAEKDAMKKQWQAEHGSDSVGYVHTEQYRALQERQRGLRDRVPEGESDYNGREYQEKILAEKLDERAEFVNTQVHEIFNLNAERFATMPAGEFLKVTEDYNK